MAADINQPFPIGPVGRADRVSPVLQPDGLQVHQVPEGGQGIPALHDGGRAVRPLAEAPAATSRSRCAPTRRTPSGPSDPKHTPYRDSVKNLRPAGYAGKLGYASAGALADFIVPGHGGRGHQRLQDTEGSDGAGAEARRALLQGLKPGTACRPTPALSVCRRIAAALLRLGCSKDCRTAATGWACSSCCRRRCCCCCS